MTGDQLSTFGDETPPQSGRWIRPARTKMPTSAGAGLRLPVDAAGEKGETEAHGLPPTDVCKTIDGLGGVILRETKRRVSSLAALERTLEDKIRKRWEESSAQVQQQREKLESELEEVRQRSDEDLVRARRLAEEEGRTVGHEEGYQRGHEEGHAVGFQEGLRAGLERGQEEGREEVAREVRAGLADAAEALAAGATLIRDDRIRLRQEARSDLVQLACEIAKKILKREIVSQPDAVLTNVEEAVDLVFRRGRVTLQLHPDDAEVITQAVESEPRWAEGFDSVEIHPVKDVGRGGCRVVSGAGVVDMTIDSQLELIQSGLQESLRRPDNATGGESEP